MSGRFWRRRQDREEAPESSPVGDECEAFLAGRYPHHLFSNGIPIPPWAWLNPLAHGQFSALQAIARNKPAPGEPVASWSGAIALLASEILTLTAPDPAALRRLQLDVIVPLELHLAAAVADPEAAVAAIEPESLVDSLLELLILS